MNFNPNNNILDKVIRIKMFKKQCDKCGLDNIGNDFNYCPNCGNCLIIYVNNERID